MVQSDPRDHRKQEVGCGRELGATVENDAEGAGEQNGSGAEIDRVAEPGERPDREQPEPGNAGSTGLPRQRLQAEEQSRSNSEEQYVLVYLA
jgi:hypothetical protein